MPDTHPSPSVLVLGAAGKTGRLVVEQALASGYAVTAFVHDSQRYSPPEGVRVVSGDATDPAVVSRAVAGQDAVVDTIGGTTPWRRTTLEQSVARAVVEAAREHGTGRIVALSAIGVGDSRARAPLPVRFLVLPTFLRGSTADKTAMEKEVAQSGLPYVLVRPAVLSDEPPTGSVRVDPPTASGITRADVASFVVEQLGNNAYLNRAVTISNG